MDISDHRILQPVLQEILRKYHILGTRREAGPSGEPVESEGYRETHVNAVNERGEALGKGPVLDPIVISHFLEVDTTPNKDWFEWLILQAGGGEGALARSKKLVEKTMIRFVAERETGYYDRKRVHHPPVSKAEALALWKKAEPNFIITLMTGDQDLVHLHQTFGFYRHWPGPGRLYEKIALGVKRFLKLLKKTIKMNQFMARSGQATVGTTPDDYASYQELEATISRVERFYASKQAREDVRIAPGPKGEKTIYDDDYIVVRAPLTYAASVRYGRKDWPWSDPDTYERGLAGNAGWNEPWKETSRNVLVYLQFQSPMPSWIAFRPNSTPHYQRYTLHNLAMIIPHDQLKTFNPDTVTLHDEENNKNITFTQIKQRLRDEAANSANYNPEDEEFPIKRGVAYTSPEEAEEIIRHLDAALEAIRQWAAAFDPSSVVTDYMSLKKQ